MPEFSYKVVEPNEDYKQAVIEKGGITATFTLTEVEGMQARNKKAKAELEGNIQIRKAEMTNIEQHYPEVKDMSGVLLTAAYLYKEAQAYLNEAEPKVKQIDDAIAQNDAMVADAMKTLGFVPTAITSNADDHGQTTGEPQKE
jgi:hypothetical protein